MVAQSAVSLFDDTFNETVVPALLSLSRRILF